MPMLSLWVLKRMNIFMNTRITMRNITMKSHARSSKTISAISMRSTVIITDMMNILTMNTDTTIITLT